MKAVRILWHDGRHVLFVILLLLAACTTSSKKDTTNEEQPYSDGEVSDASEENKKPKVHIVEIKQMKFEPGEITVHKGEKVLWINRDITDHDVTEQTTKAWASSPLKSGESWSMEVTQSADYYCNLHQVMKGKIIVN